MRYAFIAENRLIFAVRAMCRMPLVHPSGFYAWLREPFSQRALEDQRQTKLIKTAWEESGEVYGYRKLHDDLCDLGEDISPNRAWRLARLAGIRAQIGYKKKPGSYGGSPAVVADNFPMARGFIYLAAVLDWFTRRVLSWRVSIMLEADFCIEAVEEALARHGKPEILNTDQGSQFTSADFIKVLAGAEIKISMDGKGAWRDNVFVERLWRTIKYEEVYLRAYASVSEARASIGRYLGFYNTRRPHSSLDGKTPDQAYFNPLLPVPAAA